MTLFLYFTDSLKNALNRDIIEMSIFTKSLLVKGRNDYYEEITRIHTG